MAKKVLLLTICLFVSKLAYAQPGGNIVITGHDSDFHGSAGATAQIAAMMAFARSGAPNPSLPVLTFDHGSQLQNKLIGLGIPFTNIDPDIGVPAASLFDVTLYSAMAVASDSTCGGCSNTATSIANLTAAAPAIEGFLNAGGGIVALAGALRASTYYGFLPSSASGSGTPPSSGFIQTALGASLGIPAVNGDQTHNFFAVPGTGGVSAAYGAVEILPIPPAAGVDQSIVTLACVECTTSIIIPTMPQWLFLVLALMLISGAAIMLRQRGRRYA